MKAPFIIVVLLPCALCGEEYRATLQGRVMDSSGAAVPGAELTLKNLLTSTERLDRTDDTGEFLFGFLTQGLYSLTVRAPGFRTTVRQAIAISVLADVHLELELLTGSPSDEVYVSPRAPLVQPDTSATGATIRHDLVADVPSRTRSAVALTSFGPGVSGNRYGESVRPANSMPNLVYSVSGSPPGSGAVSIDGILNISVTRGASLTAWIPPLESVAEFKLQTGTLPAQYGRSGGSISNIVIKSGTNQFHAGAYEYFRNAALDANLFFPRGAGQDLPAYTSNTYGASIEGPLYRSRAFFFFNYEGAHTASPFSFASNVPTEPMLRGDFSQTSGAIYDPFSVHSVDGAPIRNAFAGNIIPASLQDPAGRTLLSYFPKANVVSPQPKSPWVQSWIFTSKWPRNYDGLIGKVDYVTPRHQSFLRANGGSTDLIFPYQFESVATPRRNRVDRKFSALALGDTFAHSARTVFDFRLGWSAAREASLPWSDGFDVTSLGFPSAFASAAQIAAFPTVTVVNFQGFGGSPYITQSGRSWTLDTSVSIKRGRHLIKTGFEGALIRGDLFRNSSPSGAFRFTPNWTDGPRADTPSMKTGFAIASLLLGLGTGGIEYNSAVAIRGTYSAIYIQDDVRVTPRLTLNVGLRYEYESPWTERYDRTTRGFAYDVLSPISIPDMTLHGGLLYAGVGGQPDGLFDPDTNNFAPRVGFAYSVDSKTVFRAGGSISYPPTSGAVQPGGYSMNTRWASSFDGIHPQYRLSDAFPNGILTPTGSSLGLATLAGENVSFIDPSGSSADAIQLARRPAA